LDAGARCHPRSTQTCDFSAGCQPQLVDSYSKSLGLIIADRGVKPACAMKTLSGKVGFALLAVIAIIIVLTIRPLTFATPTPTPCPANLPHRNFSLKIGGPRPDDYVSVDKGKLDAALAALGGNAVYEIRFKSNEGHVKDCYHPGDQVNTKTDKVIISEVAKNASAGGAAVNDPNLMHRIQSNDVTDIKKVLDAF
jgi:hypothetical protein